MKAIALAWGLVWAPLTYGEDSALMRGMIAGCLDRQVKLLGREPNNDDKRRILHFCHCQAANLEPLVSDRDIARKLQLGDPAVTKAVEKINAVCHEAVANGRRFAPGSGAGPPSA